jgi:uncharacterized protein YcbK (DUF882 family)
MKYFKLEEFACPCCGKVNAVSPIVMNKIDKIRDQLGIPLHINSGYRCVKHNAEVGGKQASLHLFGKAIDVSTANMTAEKRLQLLKLVHTEFNGIGVAKSFFHMDIRDTPAMWVY